MSLYVMLRFLHVLGAFGFVAAHGATATVTFKIRNERDPVRIRTMLDLSASTRTLMYASFLLLVVTGVWAGSLANWWRAGWIWTSIVLLTILFVAAFPLAVPYFRAIRKELEKPTPDLAPLLSSSRGLWLAWIETIGIIAIVYLMMTKPF